MNSLEVHPEKLAYWYFRLNGCFTITNFVLHPDIGRGQKTDVDIFAVRLPYREELLINSMQDDPIFLPNNNRLKVILAEVKTNTCNLNGPWTDPEQENMQRALKASGAFPSKIIPQAAQAMYSHGFYEDDSFTMTLFCIGDSRNLEIERRFPVVPQVTWLHILNFIYERFTNYKEQKCQHPQWDETGRRLFKFAMRSENKSIFSKTISITTERKSKQIIIKGNA